MKKVKIESRAANISLLGGALCLDFVNTVDWRTSNKPEEFLNSYRDLIDWSGHAGIVDDRRAGRLMRRAASHPALAAAAFQQAIELREAIYQVFAALSHARPPARRQLEKFNLALSALISRARIKPDQDCFAWLGWVPWCCGFSVAAGAIGASVKLRKIGPKGFAGLAGD